MKVFLLLTLLPVLQVVAQYGGYGHVTYKCPSEILTITDPDSYRTDIDCKFGGRCSPNQCCLPISDTNRYACYNFAPDYSEWPPVPAPRQLGQVTYRCPNEVPTLTNPESFRTKSECRFGRNCPPNQCCLPMSGYNRFACYHYAPDYSVGPPAPPRRRLKTFNCEAFDLMETERSCRTHEDCPPNEGCCPETLRFWGTCTRRGIFGK